MNPNSEPVKLLITYNPDPNRQAEYYEYVLGEFIPALQKLGLPMLEAWHTAYGEYPLRLAAFVAPDRGTMDRVLDSAAFQDLEQRLQEFVSDYQRRIVPLRNRFQF